MTDVLARIAAYKREEVAARKAAVPQGEMDARAHDAEPPRDFFGALNFSSNRPALIAEIKKASPSKGLIRAEFDPPALARAYAAGGADCLSVLTDAPSFQGHEDYLVAARAACALPVIRKDFMVDPWQVAESRAIGADAILVILAMVDDAMASELVNAASRFKMAVLVEVHDEAEMDRAHDLGCWLIGVNNRNLKTFEVDLATTERLAPLIPVANLLVCESGLHTRADAERAFAAGARAMLVGESLMRQADVAAATRALLAQ